MSSRASSYRVVYDHGIRVQEGIREVVLDPSRATDGGIVSHGHLDHLAPGAVMTPATLDVMAVRKGTSRGIALPYGKERQVNGFRVTMHDAGHVLGSAMVRVDDLLYTGDVNPEGGPTAGRAEPQQCDVLVVEATYGRPQFAFPPKDEVASDLLSWIESELEHGPVALGAYEFGKGQELMALAAKLDAPVVVPEGMARVAEVYRRHGVDLAYRPLEVLDAEARREPAVWVVPRRMLKKPAAPEVRELRRRGGKTAFISGWCSVFNFTSSHEIDAQFPLSDHGDFPSLIEFIEACRPKKVYTCFGYAEDLAREVERRLHIDAEEVPAPEVA